MAVGLKLVSVISEEFLSSLSWGQLWFPLVKEAANESASTFAVSSCEEQGSLLELRTIGTSTFELRVDLIYLKNFFLFFERIRLDS